MRTFIDLSGTARLPAASLLVEGASSLRRCGFQAHESLRHARTKWSLVSAVYAAPEQHRVHQALDGPLDTGHAVLESASRAAAALETFGAAADGIRRRRLALQSAAELMQEEERRGAGPGLSLPDGSGSHTLSGPLLQAKADQLAQELVAAEDECIRTLRWLADGTSIAKAWRLQPPCVLRHPR